MVELILSGAAVACAIGLQLVARRLKRDPDTLGELIVIAGCFLILIWAPSYMRSLIVGGFVVFAVFGLGMGVILVMLGILIATALFLPGGVSVLLCAILAIVGVTEIRAARRHLVRISRAAQLVANEQAPGEVEITGTAYPVIPVVDPVHGKPCAMWRVTGKGQRESDTLVEIRGASGTALVDPTTVRLEWSRSPEVVREDVAKHAAERLRFELLDGALMLHVLPIGAECYVVGLPSWEVAPASTVGLYRDSPMLPTFRSTPEHPAWFADRSEAQLHSDHAWAMASWGSWAALCAAIAVIQLGGWT